MDSSQAVCLALGRASLLLYVGPTLQEPDHPVQIHVSSELLYSHNLEGQPLHRNLYETMPVATAGIIPYCDIRTCINTL